MSLRNVHGQPIGVALQEGIIEDSRGSSLTELIEMTKNGPEAEYMWTRPAPYTCQVESTFGMPTWLFWTLVAVMSVAIAATVVTNLVGNRHHKERRRR